MAAYAITEEQMRACLALAAEVLSKEELLASRGLADLQTKTAPSGLRNLLEHGNGGDGVSRFAIAEDPGPEGTR